MADARNYPLPDFSMLPCKRGKIRQGSRPVITNTKTNLPVLLARNALAIIAKAELAPGSKVLLPAYHCPALVEPFLWAQCDIDFYPLNSDLSPDIDAMTAKLPAAEAIVLVPFFGFDQGIASHVQLAREYNCLPIEDLAHAAHSNTLHGDYGVTSLEKFYPVSGGGELLVADCVANTRVADWWQENYISHWHWAVSEFFRKALAKRARRRTVNKSSDSKFRYFDPAKISEPMLRRDIDQIAKQDHIKIAAARRENYQQLDAYFCHSRLGRPLFTSLGANEVPYVYPFFLHKAEYFDLIRNMAIPLYRWEEICPSSCQTSALYRSHLVQFPCHQDLVEDDIQRLISKLISIEKTIE
jgi:perosamine synthetase